MKRDSKYLPMLPAMMAGFVAVLFAASSATPGFAEDCSKAAFQKVVDDTGASLRRLHAESQARVQAGFRRLKEQRGWTDAEYVDRANELLMDDRTETFDTRASELLAKLDRGAEEAQGADACTKLAELQATALELQATVRAKTGYMLKRLEESTAAAPADAKGAPAASPAPAPTPPTKSASVEPRPAPATPAPTAPPPADKGAGAPASKSPLQPKAEVKPAPAPKTATTAPAPWSTKTTEASPPVAASSAGSATTSSTEAPSPARPVAPPMPPVTATDGFSEDDIREASRGFFGGISSGLASVIEHAFGQLGRPTGYVLGNEGGGAFIAGLRYGSGRLFTRGGEVREVYWHGPSIGYDIGAAGSKTMFLVYNLHTPIDIFSGFSGVDGSAYLVGGVGMTLLTDGKIVMAPIRSGIGVRFGASIGYVRFTARPTWNPF